MAGKIAFIRRGSVKEVGLEELYGITKKDVKLKRVKTKSGKYLEWFKNPSKVVVVAEDRQAEQCMILEESDSERLRVEISFPEFTCRCPRTSQPDFATITLRYVPNGRCVELKSWKYFLGSFRDEGHFHEQCIELIYQDLLGAIKPSRLQIVGDFNVRGGTHPVITRGEWLDTKTEEISF